MSRDIVLLGLAREKSSRIKNKMTTSFGDTSLYEIYLNKLEDISNAKNPFSDIVMGLSKEDRILWELSKNAKIPIIERTTFSAGAAKLPSDVYECLKGFNEKYMMWVNGCSAFLKPATINKIAEFFIKNDNMESLTVIKKRFNWFWDIKTNKPFTCDGKSDGSSELCEPLYEAVNCLHIHRIDALLKDNMWWGLEKNDPYLYVVDESTEFLDVDSPFDFEVAEAVWRQMHG